MYQLLNELRRRIALAESATPEEGGVHREPWSIARRVGNEEGLVANDKLIAQIQTLLLAFLRR